MEIRQGMTDAELEELAGANHGKSEDRPRLRSPWLFSSSEVYSHGRAFRRWLDWPELLPIPVFSDHGVHLSQTLSRSEIRSAAQYHLTWSRWRDNPENRRIKRIVRIPHPLVVLRRINGWEPCSDRSGTLIFVPHSLPGYAFPRFSIRPLLDLVSRTKMPEVGGLMLAMVDIRMGLHRELRELGIPLFSAGNTSSPLFAERFYFILSQFEAAMSSSVGTQTFLAEEFGVPYFVGGEPFVSPDAPLLDDGISPVEYHARQADIRSQFEIAAIKDRRKIKNLTQAALSLDLDPQRLRSPLRSIFSREVIEPRMYLRKIGGLKSKRSA